MLSQLAANPRAGRYFLDSVLVIRFISPLPVRFLQGTFIFYTFTVCERDVSQFYRLHSESLPLAR